jgi:hypothetical protein
MKKEIENSIEINIELKDFKDFLQLVKKSESIILWIEFLHKDKEWTIPYNDLIFDNSNYDNNLTIDQHINMIDSVTDSMVNELDAGMLRNIVLSTLIVLN